MKDQRINIVYGIPYMVDCPDCKGSGMIYGSVWEPPEQCCCCSDGWSVNNEEHLARKEYETK